MIKMKRYDDYIFDLYGTLVDIWTDEESAELWEQLAGIYACYGADYSGPEIMERYHALVRHFENMLAVRNGAEYPEIRIEDVFIRLLTEKVPEAFREAVHGVILDESTWVVAVSGAFRTLSRKRLAAYGNTVSTLRAIKEMGCGVHLLSNAQAVFTLPELRITGVAPFLDSIYISSDCGMKKPQPEFMRKLIAEQGLDPKHSVMVGNDFSTDMRIAGECGMDCVFLNSFRYGPERLAAENTMNAPVMDDISELLEHLE